MNFDIALCSHPPACSFVHRLLSPCVRMHLPPGVHPPQIEYHSPLVLNDSLFIKCFDFSAFFFLSFFRFFLNFSFLASSRPKKCPDFSSSTQCKLRTFSPSPHHSPQILLFPLPSTLEFSNFKLFPETAAKAALAVTCLWLFAISMPENAAVSSTL